MRLFPLCAIGCYWAILVYHLGAQWSVYEQYNYGWAVPFLCVYLLWQAKQKAESTRGKAEILKAETLKSSGQTAEGGKRKAESASGKAEMLKAERLKGGQTDTQQSEYPDQNQDTGYFSFSAFQLFSFSLLCFLYAPTRFLHEANPIWRLTSLLWTLEVIGLTLLTVHLVLGASLTGRDSTIHRSLRPFQLSAFRFSDFVFPICFFLVAVPWPSGLETALTQSLMRLNVSTTVELLGAFGVPAIRHGNVIEVGTGVVGIDEACSGIRSLQATLMLSLFFGQVYRLTIRRRLAMVLLGFALAFIFNVGRTLLLTQIASAKGIGAVASWHDPAGVTILVACFLSLWLGARAFGGKAEIQKAETLKPGEFGGKAEILKAETLKSATLKSVGQPFSISAFQRFSIFLIVWLLLVEGGTEFWYRLHERGVGDHAQWSVGLPSSQAVSQIVEIPPGIRGQFRYDEGIERRWRDANGADWQLYYFRWFPARSLSKRVTIQLAKTHGPEKCLPATGMRLKSDLGITRIPIGNLELAVHQYVFEAEGRVFHVFYGIYEDQSGSGTLVNRRLTPTGRVQAALSGSRNYGQRFLELAVVGYERPEEAKAALVRELEKVAEVDK